MGKQNPDGELADGIEGRNRSAQLLTTWDPERARQVPALPTQRSPATVDSTGSQPRVGPALMTEPCMWFFYTSRASTTAPALLLALSATPRPASSFCHMFCRNPQVLQMAIRAVSFAESEGDSHRGAPRGRQPVLGHEWHHPQLHTCQPEGSQAIRGGEARRF
jgi:hypothetical protein